MATLLDKRDSFRLVAPAETRDTCGLSLGLKLFGQDKHLGNENIFQNLAVVLHRFIPALFHRISRLIFFVLRAAGTSPRAASSGCFHNTAARAFGQETEGRRRWTSAASAFLGNLFRAHAGAQRTRRGVSFAAATVAMSTALSGCGSPRSAWDSYNRNVPRELSVGADQANGAYVRYTAHFGPQPDFRKPVAEMKGVVE